jgi:hypothetical protein
MSLVVITAPVTRSAAAADAGVDVSGVVNGANAADWTLRLTIYGPATTTTDARIAIEDSVDNFTTPHTGPTRMIGVPAGTGTNREYTFRKRDWYRMNIGVASAKLRTNLLEINNGAVRYGLVLTY